MKKFSKVLAMVMVALMMMSTVSFADAAIGEPAIEEEVVVLQLTGLTANEEATILVVNNDASLAALANTDIVYIDQLTVAEDGTVTFTLDASNAVANEAGEKYVDIYCGYTNMDVAAGPLTKADVLINPVDAPDYMYGDVDGDAVITTEDSLIILKVALGSAADYEEVIGDVDCDGVTTTEDALLTLKVALGDSSIVLGPSAE